MGDRNKIMVDPVVSSRFGKRPLLEIPPMSLSGYGQMEVTSIEHSGPGTVHVTPFANTNNPMYGSGVANPNMHPGFMTASGLPPPQVGPVAYPGYERRFNTAPNLYPAGRQYFYGPSGELISGNPLPHPSYPGVFNPYGPYGPPPRPVPRIVSDPAFMPGGPGFSVECILEYGRIVNIDTRDTGGDFRGIPPFIRDELVRTYGKYPYTEVKLRCENGEFHIYAMHNQRQGQSRNRRGRKREGSRGRKRDDSDDDSDSAYGDTYYEEKDSRFRNRARSNYDSRSEGIKPRAPQMAPRGINHERGWDNVR
ncbi:uncharacterized protein LOC101851692 [Aplysia californica]|uniref:Uncharacterized protein LOC101851692 n=1 Tax=Aplysia californica TaxID=6500 RepID=A0ABM0JC24_APLCA|nr:uncharacterized protein LOC101851692 [Aplysia californica]